MAQKREPPGGKVAVSKKATVTNKKTHPSISKVDPYYLLPLLLVMTLSLVTRLYAIHEPAHVCWDETHFGKMASWYINRTFFFDVHPPLGKMLIALSGRLTGYDGRYAFDKPGDRYQDWTQYVGMRIFCASLGMAIPALVYSATKHMTNSAISALMAGSLIVFDNGMITLTRYILLDPPLLFFISASITGMANFSFNFHPINNQREAFGKKWWFWLTWTGISIACAFSVKFVGLFIVSLIGLRTVYDIWLLLGDVSKPLTHFMKHLLARVICLIVLPIILYFGFFWVHLSLLNHSGNGDGFYSSSFQSQLIGNSLHNSSWPAHLAYNAEITLKNNRIGGAYLHSHWHLYPEGVGAAQQQVTTYSHKDTNNKWLIKRGLDSQQATDEFVRDGDLIRLEHIVTKRNLHSHFINAPITKRHFQVTCYGENGVGDANDLWQISKEYSRADPEGDDRIFTVRTRFRLLHYLSGCALHSHSKQLPKWAYEQLEVTCNPKLYDRNNFWNIEDNHYALLPNVSFEEYAPGFIDKFIESHAVMLQGNAGLKPKEGEITSRPWQWPLNYKGQFFSASKGQKIYLLGNPLIWWANIMTIPIVGIILSTKAIRNKITGLTYDLEYQRDISSTYLEAGTWTLLGWALHYIPFYFMGRVLYFHHYFPASIFSCMLTAMTFDYVLTFLGRSFGLSASTLERRKLEITCAVLSVVIYTFAIFIPLTYGTKTDLGESDSNITSASSQDEQQLASLKWLDSWEF